MKISTSGRYGIRVMLDIARYGGQNAVGRHVIAERQQVTPEYIAQIARKLAQAGLLETTMGPGGGYHLGRQYDQIRIGDIFRAMEGPVEVVHCVNNAGVCSRSQNCATRVLWVKLSRLINDYLDSINLADLLSIAIQMENFPSEECQNIEDFIQKELDSFGMNRGVCSIT